MVRCFRLSRGSTRRALARVALTQGVASAFNVHVGQSWAEGGTTRSVVGIVEDPLDTLEQFALVVPGQVRTPSEVDLLFNARGTPSIGRNWNVARVGGYALGTANPETIILLVAVLGMLLVALISVGGFTVLAQRRLRSLGMLASIGATEKQVRVVVRTNGAVVGVVGTLLGALVGLIVWLIYRPNLETSGHHVIGAFSLPWVVIGPAMGLAVIATYLSARRPARTIAKVPIVTALSGRPLPPRQVRRSALPGVLFLVAAFVLLGYATTKNSASPQVPFLVGGVVALIPGVILLAPFFLSLAGRIGGAPRSAPASRCVISPAIAPGRDRRSPRSASAS